MNVFSFVILFLGFCLVASILTVYLLRVSEHLSWLVVSGFVIFILFITGVLVKGLDVRKELSLVSQEFREVAVKCQPTGFGDVDCPFGSVNSVLTKRDTILQQNNCKPLVWEIKVNSGASQAHTLYEDDVPICRPW